MRKWNHNVGDAVEGPVVYVSREVLLALNEMIAGKALGPSVHH